MFGAICRKIGGEKPCTKKKRKNGKKKRKKTGKTI